MVASGKDLVFTNINCFKDRLSTFLNEDANYKEHAQQLLGLFPTLLGGAALG